MAAQKVGSHRSSRTSRRKKGPHPSAQTRSGRCSPLVTSSMQPRQLLRTEVQVHRQNLEERLIVLLAHLDELD
eukprot:scaffold25405_cov33-Tisochrysis_lutea.AAC.6